MSQELDSVKKGKLDEVSKDIAEIKMANTLYVFHGCRLEKGVKECSLCECWSNEDKNHFKNCPHADRFYEYQYLENKYHILIDRLALSERVRADLFPPEKPKKGGPGRGHSEVVTKLRVKELLEYPEK
jgi:hypothetical protein